MADQEKYDPQAHAALLQQLEKMELQRKAHEQAEAMVNSCKLPLCTLGIC